MDSDGTARWLPAFQRNGWVPVVFLLAFSVWALVSNVSFGWVVGATPSMLTEKIWSILSTLVQFGFVVAVLRYEGVRLREIGFGRRQFVPALVAVGGFLLAVNAAVAGLMILGGNTPSLEPFGLYRSEPLDYSLTALAVSGLGQYLLVGPVEELAFRGYLQNKLTTIFGRGSARFRTAVAIVLTATAFSLMHVPTLVIVDGTSVSQMAGPLVMLTLSGITFGAMYALTGNLVLVACLHGIGNLWPLAVDPGFGVWPNWGIIIVLYGLLVVLYRRFTPRDLWRAEIPGSSR